jgi:hypothetical protein
MNNAYRRLQRISIYLVAISAMKYTVLAYAGLPFLVGAEVTISVSDVKPLSFDSSTAAASATELLNMSCPNEFASQPSARVLMSSFAAFNEEDRSSLPDGTIFPSSDGFVRGALDAWARHQQLVLRPDEVWFEILVQLNFFMKAHAEDVRDIFVSHQGKEEIEVWADDWVNVVSFMAEEIQNRVKTDWLLEWIMPGFTTSTDNDKLTATVLMMGFVQEYFQFSGGITCGIPAVTLLGEREDWVRLLDKVDRLEDLGAEPKDYARYLRPILSRFVRTWDESESKNVKDFWTQIVRANQQFTCGGPPEYDISGWILGFLYWNAQGERIADPKWFIPEGEAPPKEFVQLDGVVYLRQSLDGLPVGYAKVPLKMIDYPESGQETMSYLLAGNVGMRREKPAGDTEADFIKVQPLSAWFMYAPVDEDAEDVVSPLIGREDDVIIEAFMSCGAKREYLSILG